MALGLVAEKSCISCTVGGAARAVVLVDHHAVSVGALMCRTAPVVVGRVAEQFFVFAVSVTTSAGLRVDHHAVRVDAGDKVASVVVGKTKEPCGTIAVGGAASTVR